MGVFSLSVCRVLRREVLGRYFRIGVVDMERMLDGWAAKLVIIEVADKSFLQDWFQRYPLDDCYIIDLDVLLARLHGLTKPKQKDSECSRGLTPLPR